MNTPNPTKQAAAANKSSKPQDASNEASQSPVTLQQLMGMLGPVLEFQKALEPMAANDLTMYWDIRLVRGRAEPFIHLQGSSTHNHLLADNMRQDATSVIQHEMTEKTLRPLVGRLQEIIDNETSADLAARKEAAEAADEDDEDAWADNLAMP